MKIQIISAFVLIIVAQTISAMVIESLGNGEQLQHFDFKTENGQTRTEDIKYKNPSTEVTADDGDGDDAANADNATDKSVKEVTTVKPVEFRGGYSFISADGYEYTVLYKANKNGFQPYVTARKIHGVKA